MPDNIPCTCPVVWSLTPQAATITPGCPVHGVPAVLRTTERQLRPLDPECANTLADLAADYAGPYTEDPK